MIGLLDIEAAYRIAAEHGQRLAAELDRATAAREQASASDSSAVLRRTERFREGV